MIDKLDEAIEQDLIAGLVLAAGKGKRMKSKTPKIFHNVGNYPMLFHVLDTSRDLKPQNITLVISKNLNDYVDQISKKYNRVNYALQKNQLGTGDAVKLALKSLKVKTKYTSILLERPEPRAPRDAQRRARALGQHVLARGLALERAGGARDLGEKGAGSGAG